MALSGSIFSGHPFCVCKEKAKEKLLRLYMKASFTFRIYISTLEFYASIIHAQ